MKPVCNIDILLFWFITLWAGMGCSDSSSSADSGNTDLGTEILGNDDSVQQDLNNGEIIGHDYSDFQVDADGHDPGDDSGSLMESSDTDLDQSCHDPAVCREYWICIDTNDEDSCITAGGTWGVIPNTEVETCLCDTEQENFDCTNANQCLSECIADPVDGVMDCTGVVKGKCAPTNIVVGCHCYFDQDGNVSGKCIG